MGTIKTTNIEPIADNGTVTLGSSGDQFTLATGAKSSFLNPAFQAKLSTTQTGVSDNVATKIELDSETFDTDGYYDNVTNYRFTPLVAGKYFVYARTTIHADTAYTLFDSILYLYKNGSILSFTRDVHNTGDHLRDGLTMNEIIEMNGTTDYIEVFGKGNVTGTVNFEQSVFGAYRIGS